MSVARVSTVKTPPYSVGAEKLVLGSVLLEPKALKPIQKILADGRAFFRPEHARLYDSLIDVCARQPGVESEQLIDAVATVACTPEQLRVLADSGIDPNRAIEQANVVAEKAKMRDFIDALSDILHDAYHSTDGFQAILDRARSRLDQVSTNSAKKSLKGRGK